jgi:hypothetical protein
VFVRTPIVSIQRSEDQSKNLERTGDLGQISGVGSGNVLMGSLFKNLIAPHEISMNSRGNNNSQRSVKSANLSPSLPAHVRKIVVRFGQHVWAKQLVQVLRAVLKSDTHRKVLEKHKRIRNSFVLFSVMSQLL